MNHLKLYQFDRGNLKITDFLWLVFCFFRVFSYTFLNSPTFPCFLISILSSDLSYFHHRLPQLGYFVYLVSLLAIVHLPWRLSCQYHYLVMHQSQALHLFMLTYKEIPSVQMSSPRIDSLHFDFLGIIPLFTSKAFTILHFPLKFTCCWFILVYSCCPNNSPLVRL